MNPSYYIKPLRAIVDFQRETAKEVESEKQLPLYIRRVDLLQADPTIIKSFSRLTEPNPYNKQQHILCLNAYDLKTVLTAYFTLMEYRCKRQPSARQIRKLFYGNADPAIRTMLRCAVPSLPAYGSDAYYRRIQLEAAPGKWVARHEP